MRQDRSRHAAPQRGIWRRVWFRWNSGDLAILFCGVLAFLSFTLGAPLLHPAPHLATGNAPASAALVPGGTASGGTVSGNVDSGSRAAPIAETGLPAATPAQDQPPAGLDLPVASPPVRIRYPSAALDVAIHPLDLDSGAQSSRTIEPPATKDGYWLTPFGVPGKDSGNTTYVIGHSWEGADAPFNHLSSAAAVGDRLEVETTAGTISYRVDSVTTYLKSSLKDSPVWDMVPNRLVLISCYTEDPWGKNVVVTAYPGVP
ncbi:class F sortase [Pseudarthrobacter sp. BRE9]|uniref:class F sortase n=1 Tax=Pseudarthrobacter sp. BRE9 TaxID=2962582 RepID=UPI00288157B9|nr:class F sortase [Pseudarthrobacter sp. BRE9]MDT0170359.1 class F sortase [Pseudarthrobacter sp. BRE9]